MYKIVTTLGYLLGDTHQAQGGIGLIFPLSFLSYKALNRASSPTAQRLKYHIPVGLSLAPWGPSF